MTDPKIVTALLTLLGALVGALASLRLSRDKSYTARERADEQISVKLMASRIKPYVQLMKQLEVVSKLRLEALDEAGRKAAAKEVFDALHRAIYGEVGLLASTVTRETIICARKRCHAYSTGRCGRDQMMDAIWAVHQMLRSDLNHQQDRVAREFDRARSRPSHINITEEVVEYVIALMPHVTFGDTPKYGPLRLKDQRRIAAQAHSILENRTRAWWQPPWLARLFGR